MDEMANKKNITKAFTSLAPRYEKVVDTELHRFWGWSYPDFINKLFELAPIEKNDFILDIATGTGVIPNRIITEGLVSKPVHGLDITMSMLEQARHRFARTGIQDRVALVCATALEMPYANATFTHVICGLATHHMSVEHLLFECQRVLRHGGRLSIADAGVSFIWKIPGVKFFLRLAAFVYFSLTDGFSRAWAEAGAVSNVRAGEQWLSLLINCGFKNISITKLELKNSWISTPLIISAVKS
jgi:ubiquinone/menaquinone biosynthesis C-methylase UbiE